MKNTEQARIAAREALIVALDGDDVSIAKWARRLQGTVDFVKVGMTNFYDQGPALIEELKERGFKIFLDLKLHDIPHQVRGAAETLGRLGVDMVTVHASGGAAMIAAARSGLEVGAESAGLPRPSLLAVTVLTSLGSADLTALGIRSTPAEQVKRLARLALSAGADGIVCSPREARLVHEIDTHASIVTPGVRPVWALVGDQARIMTPAEALEAGSTHLVVGRPITSADDSAAAARRILEEMTMHIAQSQRTEPTR